MNRKKLIQAVLTCGVVAGMSLQGCVDVQTVNKGKISSIQTDTLVQLKEGDGSSPQCRINMDFMYLEPAPEHDSVSVSINSQLQRMAFGGSFAQMSPSEAMKSAVKSYIDNYRKDLIKYYEADLHNGMKKEEIPGWYNYEYEITSELKLYADSIWNYSVTSFQNTGGAHPNTTIKWANIDASTGKELTKAQVFKKGKEKEITDLILKHLITEVNNRLETDTITSLEGLRENGALLDVDLYIPDNFLITEEGVKFLYNRYDIAPYSMGEFALTIPYAEIETLLDIKSY